MADISLKIRAEALGKSLENLAPLVENEVNKAVKQLAYAAHNAMVSKVQQMKIMDSARKDYLKGLKIQDLGEDNYLIYLDGDWANKLESGFPKYIMNKILLASQKVVEVGSRAGKPWVRKSNKDQHKYAAVPFQHHPSRGKESGDLATDLKNLMAQGTNGVVQPLTKLFTGLDDKPLSGKVATVSASDAQDPNQAGMVKFQHVHPSGKVSSVYMTFRMISETGKDWVHPSHPGYHLFQEAEKYVEREMDNIIKTLLK